MPKCPVAGSDSVIRLRAPQPGDAEAVLAVLVARDLADLGAPDFTLEDLRDEWRASDFDLSADAVVAESDDEGLIAYAAVRSRGAYAVVAPAHEGRGVGTRLLGWVEHRERALGRSVHIQWVAGDNRPAERLLSAAGYAVVRSYWRMARSLTDASTEQVCPGFALRPLDYDRDAAALHAVDDAAFSPLPDYRPQTLAAFREEHLQAHDLKPELSIVAERDGQVAGFLLARQWDDDGVGYVDILAVHPRHQGQGLGTALLSDACARCAAVGLHEVQLGVASDNPRALRLYERVGMTPRFRTDTYERPVG